jgi:uncharacterized membrane protein
MRPIDSTDAAAAFRTAAASTLTAACLLFHAAVVGAKPPVRGCQDTQYSVVDLPFQPEVISPTGVVAGINEVRRAVLWRRETGARELTVPEGFRYTEPVAITKSGSIVINASDAQVRKRRTFIFSSSSVIALVGNQTFAHGVSPSGLIVGEWVSDGKTTSDAVYWDNDMPHSIGLCCGGTFKAANQVGDMVGDDYDAQGQYHAFVWNSSGAVRAEGPALGYSSAVAINDAGHILVQVGQDGYLDQAGKLQRLDLSAKFYNNLHALNNCDFVVGGYGSDSDHYRAFLWTGTTGFRDLNSLVAGASGWTLEEAMAINDRGEIVGRGEFHNGDTGFLLTPRR